jgi:beta-glucosidase/6-phospho-beta-glucosidase/beta-galactosidase
MSDGTSGSVQQAGLDHYNRLINALVQNNIQPVVSLVHWDFPQPLQNQGGFLSSSIVNRFADYADLCFRTFGDRVRRRVVD